MSHKVNLVRVLTAATGNSTPITLGARYSTLFMSPSEAGMIDGRTYPYLIVDGNDFERGRGVYTASGTTLSRNVLESRVAGTLGTSRLNLSGTAQVRIVEFAEDMDGVRGTRAVTTTTDVLMNSDHGYVVTFSNASAIAASLAQAGAGNAFLDGWTLFVKNKGSGAVTITPATSTIDGAATLVLAQNQGAMIWSDGTNYQSFRLGNIWDSPANLTSTQQTQGRENLGIISNVGVIEYWPTSDLRAGRLKCTGGTYLRATYPDLVPELIKTGAATFTNGSANVGMPLHGRSVGDPIKLFTAGALPTNFAAGTHGLATVGVNYFVKAVVDPNTVALAATVTGSAIVAGSAGSGTHSWVCAPHGSGDGATTFTVPEFRGEFLRGWDNARGIDVGRAIGDLQLDAFQAHWHNLQANQGAGGGLYGWNGTATGSPGAGHANNRVTDPISDGINGTPRVAAETRPRNVSALITIRFAA